MGPKEYLRESVTRIKAHAQRRFAVSGPRCMDSEIENWDSGLGLIFFSQKTAVL